MPDEAKSSPAEELKLKKVVEQPKALSPLRETELTKASRIPAVTPKKKRMTSVLDAVMEYVKASTPASTEAPSAECEFLKESIEVGSAQAISEAGPLVSAEAKPSKKCTTSLGKRRSL
jgi:hypothetical protein